MIGTVFFPCRYLFKAATEMQASVRMTFQPNLVTLPKGKETSKEDTITTDLDAAIQMMSIEETTFPYYGAGSGGHGGRDLNNMFTLTPNNLMASSRANLGTESMVATTAKHECLCSHQTSSHGRWSLFITLCSYRLCNDWYAFHSSFILFPSLCLLVVVFTFVD